MKRFFGVLTSLILLGITSITPTKAQESASLPSVTILPVTAMPNEFPEDFAKRVAMVIGTLLEKQGLEKIEIADKPIVTANSQKITDLVTDYQKAVQSSSFTTDLALQVQFDGKPNTGVQSLRWLVIDRTGKVVVQKEATSNDWKNANIRPSDPMTCSAYVAEQLQKHWKLPGKPSSTDGKLVTFWKRDAGLPEADELTRMQERRSLYRKERSSKTLSIVIPKRSGHDSGIASKELAASLGKSLRMEVQVIEDSKLIPSTMHSNEQRVLWDMAKATKKWIEETRPQTDYVLCLDAASIESHLHFIHLILCNRQGDWVWVDYMNDHHQDFPSKSAQTPAIYDAIFHRLD